MPSTLVSPIARAARAVQHPLRAGTTALKIYASHTGKSRLTALGYDDYLKSRPVEAKPVKWDDLWFLYQQIRQKKPRCVLEFGSGCSTVIMAQALFDNIEAGDEAGTLLSIDNMEKWADVTRSTIPEHLNKLCNVIHCTKMSVMEDSDRVWRHKDLPDFKPDFVHLDGPTLSPEVRVAADLVHLEHTFEFPFTLVIDGRPENAEYLRQKLTGQYRFRYSPVGHRYTFEASEAFNETRNTDSIALAEGNRAA